MGFILIFASGLLFLLIISSDITPITANIKYLLIVLYNIENERRKNLRRERWVGCC